MALIPRARRRFRGFSPNKNSKPTSTANCSGRRIQSDTPYPMGRVPNKIVTAPTVSAYGIWVRTWEMWLQAQDCELSIVVSEIGEQWSPNTAPANTLPIDARSTGSRLLKGWPSPEIME